MKRKKGKVEFSPRDLLTSTPPAMPPSRPMRMFLLRRPLTRRASAELSDNDSHFHSCRHFIPYSSLPFFNIFSPAHIHPLLFLLSFSYIFKIYIIFSLLLKWASSLLKEISQNQVIRMKKNSRKKKVTKFEIPTYT